MYRLIYKSRSRTPIDWDLVNSILETSQQQNPEHAITGVLVATRNHFLQVLEGSFQAVNDLFYKIARDPRHDRLQLVSFTCTEHRTFPDWEMHAIGVFDFNRELSQQLKLAYGEEDGEVRFPIQEWEALALIQDIRQVHD